MSKSIDYVLPEGADDQDLSLSPNTRNKNVQSTMVNGKTSPESKRNAQRLAQKRFRKNQNERKRNNEARVFQQDRELEEYRIRHEAQEREIERQQETIKLFEERVQQLTADKMRWENNSEVLQKSIIALQNCHYRLRGEPHASYRPVSQPRTRGLTPNPSNLPTLAPGVQRSKLPSKPLCFPRLCDVF